MSDSGASLFTDVNNHNVVLPPRRLCSVENSILHPIFQNMNVPSNIRITVLTSRLIRCEYQAEGKFEDRPTQWVLNRDFPEVAVTRNESDDQTVIKTDALTLTHQKDGRPFRASNLSIEMKRGDSDSVTWKFGDANTDNLGGTARTLDECDGAVNRREAKPLEIHPGIFSRSGWAIIDDADSLVLNEENLPVERDRGAVQDFYFFAYGSDYESGLRDFYHLTGHTPLLPEWSLGIWWSRWEKYDETDLRRIIAEFEEHEVPLSTLVIDMDWHVVENPYTSGWTGYTWNKKFFSDPAAFFDEIHAKGIHACLNLHPAGGVHPHEDAYTAFAEFMGMDPADKDPIPFNPTDPKFLEGYFKYLHHPHESMGVDFWWIDWQQGRKTPFGDLDPLWLLNHLHSADIARDGQRRPFTFSRWCGSGAHRYPIGFSGDTLRTWRTLKYEVEFTHRAANLGYGWWSHDIGGFARGLKNDELYLRWVQFGCFSPIFRLHNAGDPTVDHRPWSKESRFRDPVLEALKLRRALHPYIYTQSKVNADGGLPLVRPMYYEDASDEGYQWPDQYLFGPDLIVAPVTEAVHPETGYTTVPVWLPGSEWCEFFSGRIFQEGRVHPVHAEFDTIPVFARAGSIIPQRSSDGSSIEAICFPGEKGEANLYMDDGESLAYQNGEFAHFRLTQFTENEQWNFRVERTEGSLESGFDLNVILRGYRELHLDRLRINNAPFSAEVTKLENGDTLLSLGQVDTKGVVLTADFQAKPLKKSAPTSESFLKFLKGMPMNVHFARPLMDNSETILSDPRSLARYATDLTDAQLRILIEFLYDAGYNISKADERGYHLSWWNPSNHASLKLRLSTRCECIWEEFENTENPRIGSYTASFKTHYNSWRLEADLLGVAVVSNRAMDERDVYGDSRAGDRF